MSEMLDAATPVETLTINRRSVTIAFLLMLAAIIFAPLAFYPVFLMKVMSFALFACAFNLLFGYMGLMSFGHAAFFGSGSYIAAWTINALGFSPELALIAALASGIVTGVVFGFIAIRRQGLYFAMVTLALAQLLYFVCVQTPATGGENGIHNSHRGAVLGLFSIESDLAAYAFVSIIFLAGFMLIARVVHSPFGQVLKATRDNEARVLSLGYPVERYKLIAFVISSALAAVAGGMKAVALGLATLTDVHFGTSGDVVLMTLLGGIGTLFGPVVGAIIGASMWEYLSRLGSWVTFIQGFIFVLCVLVFRRGIVGEIAAKLRVKL
jgi:branched-chain amino acid transport system permease protein